MAFKTEIHHRRSIRLKGYNYSSEGAYFITICTFQKHCIFGTIKKGEIHYSPLGEIAMEEWKKTSEIRNEIELGSFIVMPNHVHGIVFINTDNSRNLPSQTKDIDTSPIKLENAPQLHSPSKTIGALVRGYKSAVTKQINSSFVSPDSKIWQRNYYEHIIRSEAALQKIDSYICQNPITWEDDTLFVQ